MIGILIRVRIAVRCRAARVPAAAGDERIDIKSRPPHEYGDKPPFENAGSILLVIVSIVLVIIVLAQHGKDNYLGGAIAGGAAESFFGKNKAGSMDSTLGRVTKILTIIFVALTLFVNVASFWLSHKYS